MIIARLIGGLGNQLFQYATAKALAVRKKSQLFLDASAFETYRLHRYCLGHFKISAPVVAPAIVRNWSGYRYREVSMAFDEGLFAAPTPLYLEGYFQSERYFSEAREIILRDLEISTPMEGVNLSLLKILESTTSSVAVHVRRGDYVSNPSANAVHGTIGEGYYSRARDFLLDKLGSPIFVIFSDDIPWAKKHLSFGDRAIFVDWNDAGANYADLKLQSACRHNIIANSSFSWWGAWLGRNQDKVVIAPRDWFSHGQSCFHKGHSIVPARWVRL